MNILRRFGVAVVLTSVFAMPGLAGDTRTQPCAPPAPGITETPPCAGASTIGASLDAGGPTSPPASSVGDATLIGEIAADLLQSALSLL